MGSPLHILNQSISNIQITGRTLPPEFLSPKTVKADLLMEKFSSERCEDFYTYLDWLGLINNGEPIILPKSHHYYFTPEDLKSTETIVSLKLLNNIEKVKDFLSCVGQVMPVNSYFIGSFFDRSSRMDYYYSGPDTNYKRDKDTGSKNYHIKSRIAFLNMILNIIDMRKNRFLTKKTVSLMLETFGMKVLDMTKLNGLAYFCAQKVRVRD
jgi:hypothetical protein